MNKIEEFYNYLYSTPFTYSEYIQKVNTQRVNNPSNPKCIPGIHPLTVSLTATELINRAFFYRGQKIFRVNNKQELYLEFSLGKTPNIEDHQFSYIKASDYLSVKSILPSYTYYSVDNNIDPLLGDVVDSPSITLTFGGDITENKYEVLPSIEVMYPTRYLTIEESIERFKNRLYYRNLFTDYSHLLLPGNYFTGRVGVVNNRVFYEYFDYDGLANPKWSLQFSTLKPSGLKHLAGYYAPVSHSTVPECYKKYIGDYPAFAAIEDVGKFTGRVTNCLYHPTKVFFIYEKEEFNYIMLPSPPSPYGKEVFNMVDPYLTGKTSIKLKGTSTSSLTVNQTSSYTLTIS